MRSKSGRRVLIVGTGAMACLFGARLAPLAEVTLLGTWAAGLEALKERGIRLDSDGKEEIHRVRATARPEDCLGAEFALVLVKSWQTERAAAMLKTCLAEDGVALTLQNGLGNIETLQSALGEARAALGVTTTGATLLGPGHVRAGGSGPTHIARHPRLEAGKNLLEQAGFQVEIADDVEGLLWGKLVVNAGINPLTALLRVPNGRLLDLPEARALMTEAATEAAAVAQAAGIRIPHADPVRQVEDVARRTATNRSSMLQDILRGAPTEIDAICGAVTRQGERLGIEVPVNRTLWRLVRSVVAAGGSS